MDKERREPGVWEDLAAAVGVWRSDPRLVLASFVVAAATEAPRLIGSAVGLGGLGFLGVIGGFLFAGWVGTEQVWYRRAYADKPIALSELLPLTWAFLGRFLVFGFLAGLPMLLLFPFMFGSDDQPHMPVAGPILLAAIAGAATFVDPALAYTTRHVSVAIPKGLRMLRQHWPATAPYAVLSAAGFVLYLVPPGGWPAGTVRVVLGTLGQLAAIGAVDAWYLRRERVGENGAAYRDAADRPVRRVKRRRG